MCIILFAEAFIVGIILLIISVPVMIGLNVLYPNDYTGCINLPFKSKNKYYIATIIIGSLTHLICEYSGINSLYCRKGYACTVNKKVEITHPAS